MLSKTYRSEDIKDDVTGYTFGDGDYFTGTDKVCLLTVMVCWGVDYWYKKVWKDQRMKLHLNSSPGSYVDYLVIDFLEKTLQ